MSLRKRQKKHRHAPHIDEKWLVSYSDLMTLLFGFFVLMFSIASKNTGQAEMMSEISKAFKKEEKNQPEQTQPSPRELQVALENKTKELEDLKKQKDDLNAELLKVNNIKQQNEATTEELASIAELKKQKEDLSAELQKLEEVKNQNQEMSKQLDALKSQEFEKKKLIEEKEMLAKKIEVLEMQKSESASAIAEKEKIFEKLKDLETLKKKEEKMLSQIKSLEEAEKKAKDEIRTLKSNDGSKTFMLIFAKWETEKHDVDLTVKNPDGKVFTFKNRKFNDSPGELVLDSRYGPGAEIWTSNKLISGNYEIKITLYNQYGNLTDAKVNTTVLAGLHKLVLPETALNLKGKNTVIYKISIDNEGKVTQLN